MLDLDQLDKLDTRLAKKEATLESRSDINVNMTIPTSQTSAIPSTSAHGPTNSSANVDLGDLGVNKFQLNYLMVYERPHVALLQDHAVGTIFKNGAQELLSKFISRVFIECV